MISLEVIYESYPDARLHTIVSEGYTVKHALINALDTVQLYLQPEEAEDMTISEILDAIDDQNGDGCAFIYSIKNLNTDETYLKSEYYSHTRY